MDFHSYNEQPATVASKQPTSSTSNKIVETEVVEGLSKSTVSSI